VFYNPLGDTILHLLLHLLVPLTIALLFYRKKWALTLTIMLATMLIDLDHLLATPIYQATRCSVGFHPMHTLVPIIGYCLLCLFPKTRIVGIGLVIHILLDSIDCQFTRGVWFVS